MTTITTYDVGDVAHLRVSFTNSAGQPVDPSSVELQYRHTAASVNSVASVAYTGASSLSKAGTGEYFLDLPINSETLASLVDSGTSMGGRWRARWNGYGNNAAAVEREFNVNHRIVG